MLSLKNFSGILYVDSSGKNEPFKSLKIGNFMKNTILTILPECHCADALGMDGVL